MFTSENLEFYYSVSAPVGGGKTELSMFTNTSEDNKVSNYIIKDEDSEREFFSIYDTGLVVYLKQTSSLIEFYSNREFSLQDDGSFKVCD